MNVKEAIETIEKFGIDCHGYLTLEKAVDVVLEYTKTQLSQEDAIKDTTSDTIYRQAAIDVIEAGRLTKLIDAETAINGLRALPSA